jgi:hypothetical protein
MDEILAQKGSVGTFDMQEEQRKHLNPALEKCGTLPSCRGCNLLFGAQVIAVAERVAPRLR